MRLRFVLALVLAQTVAAQPPPPSLRELRDLLSNKNLIGSRKWDTIFYYETKLRPAIRELLRDPKMRDKASEALALIGDSEDIRLVIRSAPRSNRDPFGNRWAYAAVCALVDHPGTELEWRFLRACALNNYNDRWVDAGAIQTLKLIASPRSLQILKEASPQNAYRTKSIARAIQYIESGPPPLAGASLDKLIATVAEVVKIGEWEGFQNPRYNERRDKALVDLIYYTWEDRFTYTATFHKVNGAWKLRGIRETLQALVFRGVMPTPPLTELPPPPDVVPVPQEPPIGLGPFLRPSAGPSPPSDVPPVPRKK